MAIEQPAGSRRQTGAGTPRASPIGRPIDVLLLDLQAITVRQIARAAFGRDNSGSLFARYVSCLASEVGRKARGPAERIG